MRPSFPLLAAGALTVAAAALGRPAAANAFNPACPIGGAINGLAQTTCQLGGAGGLVSSVTSALTLAPLVAWVLGGATFVLHATSHVLGQTTSPQLGSTWFSSTYWRVAGIAAVLTLPFLFAAAVQALIRSDLGLLLRAALGYLPLAALAVAIAAPLTMLLLAASDQLSASVSSAAGQQVEHFLSQSISRLGAVGITVSSPFVVFLVGLLTVAGAITLWIELLVREAAVYVIVLLLPLAFAAFVWPARRIWAIRSVEVLIALILSKFVIVAVLSLGGAALDQSAGQSVTGLLAGGVLMALAAFAPWAVLRLIPLAELASAAAGSLKGGSSQALLRLQQADAWSSQVDHWALKTAQMREAVRQAGGGSAPPPGPEAAAAAEPPPSHGETKTAPDVTHAETETAPNVISSHAGDPPPAAESHAADTTATESLPAVLDLEAPEDPGSANHPTDGRSR
jgi:hypothetical protein